MILLDVFWVKTLMWQNQGECCLASDLWGASAWVSCLEHGAGQRNVPPNHHSCSEFIASGNGKPAGKTSGVEDWQRGGLCPAYCSPAPASCAQGVQTGTRQLMEQLMWKRQWRWWWAQKSLPCATGVTSLHALHVLLREVRAVGSACWWRMRERLRYSLSALCRSFWVRSAPWQCLVAAEEQNFSTQVQKSIFWCGGECFLIHLSYHCMNAVSIKYFTCCIQMHHLTLGYVNSFPYTICPLECFL